MFIEEQLFNQLPKTAQKRLILEYRKFRTENKRFSPYCFTTGVVEMPVGYKLVSLESLLNALDSDDFPKVCQKHVVDLFNELFDTGTMPGVIRVERVSGAWHVLSGHELIIALGFLITLEWELYLHHRIDFWRPDIAEKNVPVLLYTRVF